MSTTKSIAMALVLAGGFTASQASAQSGLAGALSGAYVGGSLGQSSAEDACDGIAPGLSCDDEDDAWRIFGGYQINRNFAAEVGYADLGEVEAAGGAASAEATAWDLVGVGMVPIGESKFSLFGKAGLYRAEVDAESVVTGNADEDNTDLTYGVGARYDFTRNVAVRAEWQRYQDVGGDNVGGESDIDVLSVGVQYLF